jgi:tRNA(Ile)-lysidine synthase
MVLTEVRNFLGRHSVKDRSVLLAVSGGIDSVTLLHALLELRDEFNLELPVAHLDHGLRGESSTGDAEFVRKLTAKLNLNSTIETRPVNQVAEQKSLSLEEAARSVRYDFLDEVAAEKSTDFIALGHNRNDQAETILMNILRGTGLRGLGGMRERNGPYIRPLLNVPRDEIARYVEENQIEYRVDETNKDTSFTRNRIRHELMPELEADYNSKVVDSLVRLGELAKHARDFTANRVEEVVGEIKIDGGTGGLCFDRKKLLKFHPYLQRATIRKLIKETKGDLRDISFTHVEVVLDKLKEEPASTRLDLPGVTFSLDREKCCFGVKIPEKDRSSYRYELQPGEETVIEEAKLEISANVEPLSRGRDDFDFPSDRLIEVVDWRKVERPILVRNRSDGDRFVPLGMNGEKKLKDFFIDLKIPRRERDRIPLVCDETGIIWVVGYRIDDRYRVDETTDEILIIKARNI